MVFYLKPPRGLTNLEKVCICAKKRLRFLCLLSKCTSEDDIDNLVRTCCATKLSEYLIEGTTLDRMSHFMLRLFVCNVADLTQLVLDAETKLFHYRFSHQTAKERARMLRAVSRHIKEIISEIENDNFSMFLRELNEVVDQLINGVNSIQVGFQYVLEMVRHRDVVLKDGIASVTADKELDLVVELFRSSLSQGFRQMRFSSAYAEMIDDPRLLIISKELEAEFDQRSKKSEKDLVPQPIFCVNNEAKYFPLCMLHLHDVLNMTHKLRHQSRVQYTLFLKDIGLTLNAAINYWKEEYSKPSVLNSEHSCKWKGSAKRYEYGIKHMYGLEGRQINYKSHCCSALQTSPPNAAEEGGCPFVYFDRDYLKKYLQDIDIPKSEVDEICQSSQVGQYKKACLLFMQARCIQHVNSSKIVPKSTPEASTKLLDINNINDVDMSSSSTSDTDVNVNSGQSNCLNGAMSSSVCKDHICCPSQSSDEKLMYDIKRRDDKPALIYLSFKKLLNNLRSIEK